MNAQQRVISGQWVPIAGADEVPEGAMIGVEVGDLRIAVYNVAGVYYATSNVCTHQFALLTDGWLDGAVVECPLHGGQFDITCGRAMGGIVENDLATFDIRKAEGILEIKI